MKKAILVLFLLFVALGLRLLHPKADPPSSLSWSGALLSDEGYWCHNAANKVLFDKWETDNFNPYLVSPVFTLFEYASFKTGGVDLIHVRLPNIIFGTLSILILYLITQDWLAAILLTLNYIFVMYNRMALLETTVIFFLLLSLLTWQKEKFTLSGVFLAVSILTKVTASFFIFVLLLQILFFEEKKKKPLRFLLGLALVILPFILVFVIPSYSGWKEIQTIHVAKKFTHPLLHFKSLALFFTTHFGLVKIPFLYLLAFLGSLQVFSRVLTKREIFTRSETIVFLWLLIGALFLGFFPYQPPRYLLLIIPPMCVEASFTLRELKKQKSLYLKFVRNFFKMSLVFLGIFLSPIYILNLILGSLLGHRYIVGGWLILSVIISALLILRGEMTLRRKFLKFVYLGGVTLIILNNGFQYLKWAVRPEYSILNASRKVKEIIGEKAILGGEISSTLSLENHVRAIPFLGTLNREYFPQLTYLITYGNEEIRRYQYMKLLEEYKLVFSLVKSIKIMHNYYTHENFLLFKLKEGR